MPTQLYMGGSFIDSSVDATKFVEGPSFEGTDGGRTLSYNRAYAGSSTEPHATTAEPVDFRHAIRIDGHGTKHAAAEKNKQQKKQVDERIWILRKEQYSDKDISKKIEEEFGVAYQPKSIASRLPKIQRQKQAEEDARLDDELSDWHVGEDEKLYISYDDVEKKINAGIAKLEARKWENISKSLADKMLEKRYTGEACKERFEGLLDGTALLPIELDPDQEGRKVLRENRIAEAKRTRAEAEAAILRAAEAIRQEKIQHKVKEAEVKAARKAQAEAKKADDELHRQMKKHVHDAKSEVVRKRREMERKAREEKIEWWKTRELENLVYGYYTGRVLQRKHRGSIKNGDDEEDFLSDDERLDANYILEDNEVRDKTGEVRGPAIIHNPKKRRVSRPKKAQKEDSSVTKGRISKQSLLNPRSILTLEELDLILAKRDLPRRTVDETHPQVVARIAAADKALSVQELESLLRLAFVPLRGSHAVKVEKLQEHDANESEAGKKGTEATDLEFKKSYEGYYGKGAKFIDGDE